MTEPVITCPNCSSEIKLTESLAAPLIEATKDNYEKKLVQVEKAVAKREEALKEQQKLIEEAREAIEEQVNQKLAEERKAIAAQEAKKAKAAAAQDVEAKVEEIGELKELLDLKNTKLEEAQKAQAEVLRKERALEDQKRELDLTVEKRVQDSISEVREKAKLEAEEGLKLKVSEKEEQIASMQRQIEDLKRKAEQGSQQLQGEVLELELEATLSAKFPFDSIEPVGKGEFGGDVLQRVSNPNGSICGSILWESKRTKNWSEGWLAKLRGDQRAAKAEIALLVSHALPKGLKSFDLIDGVWVTHTRYAMPLALALRQSLIELSAARQSRDGQETKMELVYDYLTGPKFRHRVEAIFEKIQDMQKDLEKERKMMMRHWAKRESQIQVVIEATYGMYGDLQGIAGQAIQEIDGLDVPLLEDDAA